MALATRPLAHLAGCASAFPRGIVDQATTIAGLQRLFPAEDPEKIRGIVERSGVEQRRLVPSVAEIMERSTFTERNRRYREDARTLALEASRAVLARTRTDPERVDVLIDVSCTGLSIPALDVELAPLLGLREDVRRVPITESGCAAGALALGIAGTFASAGACVLVVAVELCSLTLIQEDRSRTNLVSAALFGDGAAAALLLPGGAGRGPRLLASGSHLVPETREAMGFDVGTHGLRILLQRELPLVLEGSLRPAIERFLATLGRSVDSIGLHLVHPGGRRILDAYQAAFELPEGALFASRESLRRYGNLSSASILTVLELALERGFPLEAGKEALVIGVGPGLSFELALFGRDEVP